MQLSARKARRSDNTAVPTSTTSTLSVSTSPTTKQGNYTLTVTGTGNGDAFEVPHTPGKAKIAPVRRTRPTLTSFSMRFEIAGTVRLALMGADERTERVVCRELDPYGPIDGRGDPDLTLEAMPDLPAPIDLQNPAADALVTATDGNHLQLLVGGRSCTVPRLALQGPFQLGYERGFPLAHIFGSVVRPTIQLALEDHNAVAVHSAGVEYDGSGIVVGGWSESGKTEAALALMELGARFVSDKWTVVGADSSISPFPISVGVRRWALRYLPRLRRSLPTIARAQLAVAGLAAAVTAPARARQSENRVLEVVRAAVDKGVALADRASVRPSDLARAYGQSAPAVGVRLGAVVLLTTVPGPDVSASLTDSRWGARRLARSAAYERRAFFDLHRRARYALPQLDDELEGAIERREEQRLQVALRSLPVIEVKAPFPADPRRVAEAILARLQ